jgi:hypothetical protein
MSPPKRTVEERWRGRLQTLSPRQWQTDTWKDLCEILEMLEAGETEAVEEWIEETRDRFEAARGALRVADYRFALTEAELAERFLCDGVRDWLDALRLLENGAPTEQVRSRAESGQRFLIGVQMLEQTFASRGKA